MFHIVQSPKSKGFLLTQPHSNSPCHCEPFFYVIASLFFYVIASPPLADVAIPSCPFPIYEYPEIAEPAPSASEESPSC